MTHAPPRRLVQCRCAENYLDAAHTGALLDPLPLEAKDLLQAGPAAILGGQGVGGLPGGHFNAAAVQVRLLGRRERLPTDNLGIREQGGDVVRQGGLVIFSGQDIVTTLADGTLGLDDPHLRGERRQHLHGVLTALPAAAHRLTVQGQRSQTR